PAKLSRLGYHPIFDYSLRDIAALATFKPAEKLSTKQRHLLFCAMLHKFGTVGIKYPIMPRDAQGIGVLGATECLLLWPAMQEILVRICTHSQEWRELVPLLPRFEIRADNWQNGGLPEYIRNVLLPNTTILTLGHAESRKAALRAELFEDEISLE